MNPDPVEQLPAQTREELAICGISSFEQLAKSNPAKIAAELMQARVFFPERTFVLNETELRHLSAEAKLFTQDAEQDIKPPITKIKGIPTTRFHTPLNTDVENSSSKGKQRSRVMLHSPVRSSHPFLALFAALSTLLLLIPFFSTLALIAMLVTQTLPVLSITLPKLIFLGIVLPSIPFLIFERLAACPVCHIRIFRLSKYSRHKGAHHLPLLGFNMATALHLLFRAYYVCPGCGTPVRLISAKKHHH